MADDPYQGMTAAQIREAKRAERNAANWRGVKVERRRGVAEETLQREAEALAYCSHPDRGHRLRSRGTQACRVCLHEANMGRLGRAGPELSPLPSAGVDPVCRMLDAVLADFGEYGLEELLARVNDQRAAANQKPYTMPALSIRLRELREHGRTVQHAPNPDGGGDIYWYQRPDQPALIGG
jgi:hypothetical protein